MSSSGDKDDSPLGFDDKDICRREEMLNYFLPSEEVKIPDIEKALSFCHRTWMFLVDPAGPAAKAMHLVRTLLRHRGLVCLPRVLTAQGGLRQLALKRMRLEVGESSSLVTDCWFPHLGGFSEDLSFLKLGVYEVCAGTDALKLMEGCVPWLMQVGWIFRVSHG